MLSPDLVCVLSFRSEFLFCFILICVVVVVVCSYIIMVQAYSWLFDQGSHLMGLSVPYAVPLYTRVLSFVLFYYLSTFLDTVRILSLSHKIVNFIALVMKSSATFAKA